MAKYGAALAAIGLAMLALAACGSATGAASATDAAHSDVGTPAPVLTYYLDQTFTALGDEPSSQTGYRTFLKICESSKLHTTPLSAADVKKLATERRRVWQQPNERVVQRDTWTPTASFSKSSGPCLFSGIKEHSIREIRVPPQTLYVMDLQKGTVDVQTQAGPPTAAQPPITAADLKAFEVGQAAKGYLKKVGDSHALGQPCAVWQGRYPDGSLWFTECGWTGGLANGITPLSILLWRNPATTRIGDKRAITTTAFTVGHLPPGSDAVFKLPAHAKSAGGAGVAGVQQ